MKRVLFIAAVLLIEGTIGVYPLCSMEKGTCCRPDSEVQPTLSCCQPTGQKTTTPPLTHNVSQSPFFHADPSGSVIASTQGSDCSQLPTTFIRTHAPPLFVLNASFLI